MYVNSMRAVPLALACLLAAGPSAKSQSTLPGTSAPSATQAAAPHQSGTVKAVTPQDFVLTTPTGQDYAVTVPAAARILVVPPDNPRLSAAQPGTMADIAAGDRVIVNGSPADTGQTLTAARVIVMKSNAIAASHAAEQAAWARGAGGIVRSVDPASGAITLASGMRTLTVTTTPKTVVRRYAGSSVRFEDAVASTLSTIQPGDQMRVRGERSPDGTTVMADEIVAGSFSNFSGVLSAVDAGAGTVTLKDLATKHTVTVAVTAASNLRRLPPGMGQGMGARARGDNGGTAQAAAAGGTLTGGAQNGGAANGGTANGGTGRPGGTVAGRPGGAGADLSRMLNRLPTETLAGLKPGEAVMIVAANGGQSGQPTAITLLVGVEQILAAHPSGETTLSPWSLNTGGQGEGEAGGG